MGADEPPSDLKLFFHNYKHIWFHAHASLTLPPSLCKEPSTSSQVYERSYYNNNSQIWIQDLCANNIRPLLFIDEEEPPSDPNLFYNKNKQIWIKDPSSKNLRHLLFDDNNISTQFEENSYYNNNYQIWIQDLSTNNIRPI